MQARHLMTLSACVLVTLAACGGEAFTAGGPDADGSEDASSDSPRAGDDGRGGDANAGDSGGGATGDDAVASDAVAYDAVEYDGPNGPPPHDASSNDGTVGPPKLVFITSHVYSGNLGGLSGADALCQNLASQASHSGTFKAWLSSTAISAGKRLTHSTGPYVLANGTQVASGWAGLTSGTLLHPIDVTETGGAPPTPTVTCSNAVLPAAWTSTAPDGSLAGMGATCGDWTTAGPSNGAYLGVASQTGAGWTDGCGGASSGGNSALCGLAASLYCVEQ